MADALMGWDPRQSRWRKRYKGVPLRIRASDLGGKTRTDTVVAANRWFREQQERIDRELATSTYRPNELEYLSQLDSIQSSIKTLLTLMRGNPDLRLTLGSKVEILKQKEVLIKQTLQKPILPPINDTFCNPLYVSPERIEGEAVKEAREQITDKFRSIVTVTKKEVKESIVPHDVIELEDYFDGESYDYHAYSLGLKAIEEHNKGLEESIREEQAQAEAEYIVGLKDGLIADKKKEAGLLDSEYDRGITNQLLKEHGAIVPTSKQLDRHVEAFKGHLLQFQTDGSMSKSRANKIRYSLDYYLNWTNITNIERIANKDHIDSYFRYIWENVFVKKTKAEGKIADYTGRDVWQTFRQFLHWLADEQTIGQYPSFLIRKDKKYTIRIAKRTPKKIALQDMRVMLKHASPTLKLFLMLTLNCGFTQVDIGKLRVDCYNADKGKIVHKRSKTEDYENVPTVTYLLWTETKELLDQAIDNQKKRFPEWGKENDPLLLNQRGKSLWEEKHDD